MIIIDGQSKTPAQAARTIIAMGLNHACGPVHDFLDEGKEDQMTEAEGLKLYKTIVKIRNRIVRPWGYSDF